MISSQSGQASVRQDGSAQDQARFAALATYDILDTAAETGYDDIVTLAAQICEAPVALVSLVDRERQWFKAKVGLDASETPIEHSVCAHAIRQREMLVIPDLSRDRRTENNPLVAGEPFIRFYAGARLDTPDGTPLGTLCVLDYTPRPEGLRPDQASALRALARQVMTQMELRRLARAEVAARRDIQASRSRYRAIFESAVDYAIIVMDRDGLITDWNEGATRILGWTPAEICGRDLGAFFTPEDKAAGVPEGEIRNAITRGRGLDERWHLRKTGERFWASGEMMPLRSETGSLEGYVKILRDRTEHRQVEKTLRESEERLGMLFAVSGAIGWWDWTISSDVVVANEHFARMYSVDPNRAAAGVPIGAFLHGIHPDDRDWVAEDIQRAIAKADAFSAEYRLLQPDGTVTWVLAQGRCYQDADGRPSRFPGVSIDITERKAAEARRVALVELGDILRDEDDPGRMAYAAAEILGRALGVSRAGYGTVNAASETIEIEHDWNAPGLSSIAGQHRFRDYGSFIGDLKRGDTVLLGDVTTDPRSREMADALQAIGIRALANMPLHEHGAFVAVFFLHDAKARVWLKEDLIFMRNVADRVRSAIERIRAEDRQKLLNQELSHRLKNTLAMVQAIAAQTLRNAPDLTTAQKSLSDRMVALGKAHDLLLKGVREAAGIRDLIEGALAMHDEAGRRFRLSGPAMLVGSRAALSLALMIHELATNAVKYGALSRRDGSVSIDWCVDGDPDNPELRLSWVEHGGPAVAPPTRRGFGSRLIERGLAGQIGGTVTLSYDPGGVVCKLSAPLAAFVDDELHPPRTNVLPVH